MVIRFLFHPMCYSSGSADLPYLYTRVRFSGLTALLSIKPLPDDVAVFKL